MSWLEHHPSEWEVRNPQIVLEDNYRDVEVRFSGVQVDTFPALHVAEDEDGNRFYIHDYDLIRTEE